MKKIAMMVGVCMTLGLSSCVWSESVDEVLEQVNNQQAVVMYAESRTANGLVCDSKGNYVFTDIDWKKAAGDQLKEYVSGEDGYIAYLYNGAGGTFVHDDSGVGIKYSQSGSDVMNDRFGFAVTNVLDIQQQNPLEFQDAFAGLQLKITNRISNLVLEIKDFKIANIAREGFFMFPQDGLDARWTDRTMGGSVDVNTDTLVVQPGDSLILLGNNPLPVIPQKTRAWSPGGQPVYGGGSYLLLNCRISYTSEDTARGIAVWCDEDGGYADVAIPVSLNAKMRETCTIELVMETGCPWYSLRYANPTKILRPITFSPSVEDWMDVSSNINI